MKNVKMNFISKVHILFCSKPRQCTTILRPPKVGSSSTHKRIFTQVQLAIGRSFGKHKETRRAKFVIKTIIIDPVRLNVALSPCRGNTHAKC